MHVAILFALQSGLVQMPREEIVQVEMLSDLIEAPRPVPLASPPMPLTPTPRPAPTPPPAASRPLAPRPAPVPLPKSIVDATPAPLAPIVEPSFPAPSPSVSASPTPITRSAVAPSPPAPFLPAPVVAPASMELPSSSANYLSNPKPVYPSMSRRLGEQGKVMLRVLISAEGAAQQVELLRTSGFDRLDQSAITAVRNWKFTPGKRNGVAETMWNNVPINFSLD